MERGVSEGGMDGWREGGREEGREGGGTITIICSCTHTEAPSTSTGTI